MPQFTGTDWYVVVNLFMSPNRTVATVVSYLFENLNKALFSVNGHVEVLLVTMDVADKGPQP